MNDAEFRAFQTIVRERTGNDYPDDKRSLLETRVRRRIERLRLTDPTQYLALLENGDSPTEWMELIDTVTTHETWFRRCPRHWEFLRTWLTQRVTESESGRTLRAWSAGTSTGEEAYGLAMLAAELRDDAALDIDLEVLGTDISQRVIDRARTAAYDEHALREVDAEFVDRHFVTARTGVVVRPEIAARVTFRQHNVLDPAPAGGPFDLVLVRNCLIYLDPESKNRALEHVHAAMGTDGLLVLGESESLLHDDGRRFRYLGPSMFTRRPRSGRSLASFVADTTGNRHGSAS